MLHFGALEAGGTKMVLSILDENRQILVRESIPTEPPSVTMPVMIDFFRNHQVDSLGIGCFGPLDLNPASASYGSITKTPKLAWKDYPILSKFREALQIPCAIDTDVNAAALAEHAYGAAQGLGSCLYVTIGTGIGGGLVIDGKAVHGLVHPELGHMLLRPVERDPSPDGFCPYHKGCLEGLAAGPALEKRWGMPAFQIPEDHVAWDIEAYYLASMCHNAITAFSPEKIILGGGVMHQHFLFDKVRRLVAQSLNGYIASPAITDGANDYIVPPGCGENSGVLGAYLLARRALEEA
ncbi:MAG: ROK family protein [Clostridia bacterium]|nr:ROK family protein [Clostridia bacterium]